MIVADTNVVSELMRDDPSPSVLTWAEGLGSDEVAITVVTVEEIRRGIARLPLGRRRTTLATRWEDALTRYAASILSYDVASATATADVLVAREAAALPMSLADAQIAGMCLAGGHSLATRNVRDFLDVPDLEVIDPFS